MTRGAGKMANAYIASPAASKHTPPAISNVVRSARLRWRSCRAIASRTGRSRSCEKRRLCCQYSLAAYAAAATAKSKRKGRMPVPYKLGGLVG